MYAFHLRVDFIIIDQHTFVPISVDKGRGFEYCFPKSTGRERLIRTRLIRSST